MPLVTQHNRKWWTVAAMAVTTIVVTFDSNGLTVALPTIGRAMQASTTDLQWTVNAYMLAFAAPTVAAGRLADIFGRRRVVIVGTVVFAAGSALCGLAQDIWWLVAARVVQGAGAAAFFAASLSVVSNAFPPEERGAGIGAWAAVGTVGLAAGPLAGGFLTEALSWRWFFLVNIPIVSLAVFLTAATVRESRDETAQRHVDLLGLSTVTLGLTALVLGLQQSDTLGWGSPVVIVSMALGTLLLAVFAVVEPRLRDPLIELGLFGQRAYLGANAVGFAQNFGFGALMFFLTLYLQYVLDYSPLQTGAIFLAFMLTVAVSNLLAGRLEGAIGPRYSMAAGGMVLAATAFLLLALIKDDSGVAMVVAALAIAGVGLAIAYTVSTTSGMAAIPEAKAGAASGIMSMVRLMGAVFGVAVPGAWFNTLEDVRLERLLTAAGYHVDASERATIQELLSGSEAAEATLVRLEPPLPAEQAASFVREAFVYALGWTMLLCVVVSAMGFLAAFLAPSGAPHRRKRPGLPAA